MLKSPQQSPGVTMRAEGRRASDIDGGSRGAPKPAEFFRVLPSGVNVLKTLSSVAEYSGSAGPRRGHSDHHPTPVERCLLSLRRHRGKPSPHRARTPRTAAAHRESRAPDNNADKRGTPKLQRGGGTPGQQRGYTNPSKQHAAAVD